MNRRVTVVGGAGNVGGAVARAIAVKELADVVLIDALDSKATGMALDMYQAGPVEGSDSSLIGGGTWEEAAGSDIIVVTSGRPRKPGMSRDDLVRDNFEIMKSIAPNIVKHCPDAIMIPVANPIDAMAQALYKLTKFPKDRVVGMAGVLDSARLRTFIAMELKVSVENVHAMVLGGHGDTMVPITRYSTVAGVPVAELIPKDRLDAIVKRTENGGGELTKFIGTSPWFAPGSSVVEMVEAMLKDKHKILMCSVRLDGEFGLKGLFLGVPCKIGAKGLEEIVQIKLNAEESAALQKSADATKELLKVIDMNS